MLSHNAQAVLAIIPILVHSATAEDVRIPMEACRIDIAETQSYGQSNGSEWCGMRVTEGAFVNGIKTWSTTLGFRRMDDMTHRVYRRAKGWMTGIEVSFTDGKSTMIGTQDGTIYSEIKWDPEETIVDWMTGRDEPSLAEEYGEVPFDGRVAADDEDGWLNVFEVYLSDGQYLCGGADQYAEKNYHQKCKKEKPKDPRHSIGGTLLGFSGALGSGGIEGITAYILKSDAEGTEIHDVVLSPTIEELNERSGKYVLRSERKSPSAVTDMPTATGAFSKRR